jgi:hypothetical protein
MDDSGSIQKAGQALSASASLMRAVIMTGREAAAVPLQRKDLLPALGLRKRREVAAGSRGLCEQCAQRPAAKTASVKVDNKVALSARLRW